MDGRIRGASAGLALLAMTGAGAAGDPLTPYRWKARVLVVSAPDPGDRALLTQRRALASVDAAARERDLVLIEALGDDARAQALRRRFGLPQDAFGAVLVGKDGGAKLTSTEPIPPRKLFSTIDAMPMRRDEMRGR